MTDSRLFIGVDIGTSACRACAIDGGERIVAEARRALPAPVRRDGGVEQDPQQWLSVMLATLDDLFARIDGKQVRRLLIDGTSSTLLLADADGRPLTPGLMYNDTRAIAAAERIAHHAPDDSAARGAGSSLAKLLHLQAALGKVNARALHQADWLAGTLCADFGFSDENNALKLGYDPRTGDWPSWLQGLLAERSVLPRVLVPGAGAGRLLEDFARRWDCREDVEIAAGTTDSTAGFIASGARREATAVTALGSTLVLKVLSPHPVYAPRYGVYSHRLGGRWLVGGASNAGGAVLRAHFGACEIHRFTRLMRPDSPTGLDYYPLNAPGERFPLCDPHLQPRLTPRPASDAVFFQAILEGLAHIERQGYRRLERLGAPYPREVISVGGGAANRPWRRLRQRLLGVPVRLAEHQEAAYGAALLAARGEAVFAHV